MSEHHQKNDAFYKGFLRKKRRRISEKMISLVLGEKKGDLIF